MTAVLQADRLGFSAVRPDGQPLAIVKDVSLEVQPGEAVAIVGASGSGKTTVLSMLGLLTTPTSGAVSLRGTRASSLSDRRRSRLRNEEFGFVFQNYSLMGHLSAIDNVMLPLLIGRRACGLAEARRRAEAELEKVGLGDRADAKPRQLSGGEQQRVAIARALIRHPSVLLADEPTGALDQVTAASVLAILHEAAAISGCAVVLVTHDPEVARSARSVRLDAGKVI